MGARPGRGVDWDAVRVAFERGEGTAAALAARFGIAPDTFRRHARAAGWQRPGARTAPPARSPASTVPNPAPAAGAPGAATETGVPADLAMAARHARDLARLRRIAEHLLLGLERRVALEAGAEDSADGGGGAALLVKLAQIMARIIAMERALTGDGEESGALAPEDRAVLDHYAATAENGDTATG